MDVHGKLDGIIALVESARAMPMSTSCVVNRGELLGLLSDLRSTLPHQMHEAEQVLGSRDSVLDDGRREAQRVLDDAYAERSRLLSSSPSAQEAFADAERIRAGALEEAQAMRAEVDDYVDAKLANFEVVLTRTMTAVQRGRDRLRANQQPDAPAAGTDEHLAADYPGYQTGHTTGQQPQGYADGYAAGYPDGRAGYPGYPAG
ncbi:MAG: hypothetical protein ACRDYU_17950 [Actinomycetes bacterium]